MDVWLNLARRLRKFDPITLANALLTILINPKRHYTLLRRIRRFNGGRLIRYQPHLHLKYLNPRHLAHSLSRAQRASALVYNLAFIESRFASETICQMIDAGFCIWKFADNYILMLRFEHLYTTEGELTLGLRNGAAELYALSFTFVCGSLLGFEPVPLMFITRVQGGRGVRELIETTVKDMGQTHPRYVLLAALQGIAKAVGIDAAIGISATDQVCRNEFPSQNSVSYEAFYKTIGSVLVEAKTTKNKGHKTALYYRISLPLPEKDIGLISAAHRRRSMAKRNFRKQIAEEVFEAAYKALA